MVSDKYTKHFSDFSSYSYQGQILPNMFDHTDKGGDGQSGLQGMLHGIISAYGPAHIIDGIEVESGDPNYVTGTAGYYMWSGAVKQLQNPVIVQLTGNDYAYLSGDGTLNASCTGEWGSGVTIALSGNASDGIQDIRQVWVGSKLKNQYFERIHSESLTGTNIFTEKLRGIEITGSTGIFENKITSLGFIDGGGNAVVFGDDIDLDSKDIDNIDNFDERIYFVSTDTELDNAIADITANNCAGRIIITDSLTNVQVTIDGGSSSFIIEGNGDSVVLDSDGTNTVFTVTNCLSCVIRELKVDNGGYGILISSDNVDVIKCSVNGGYRGIHCTGNYCKIIDNKIQNLTGSICYGIYNTGSNSYITGNYINNLDSGAGADPGNNAYGIYNSGEINIIYKNIIKDIRAGNGGLNDLGGDAYGIYNTGNYINNNLNIIRSIRAGNGGNSSGAVAGKGGNAYGIYNSETFVNNNNNNIYGITGGTGGAGSSAWNANDGGDAYGIYNISNFVNNNNNNIYIISGGTGGSNNGMGWSGKDGGDAYGICMNNCTDCNISLNIGTTINEGAGGAGGAGGSSGNPGSAWGLSDTGTANWNIWSLNNFRGEGEDITAANNIEINNLT